MHVKAQLSLVENEVQKDQVPNRKNYREHFMRVHTTVFSTLVLELLDFPKN